MSNHSKRARIAIERATDGRSFVRDGLAPIRDAQVAQAEATLELAYQQRMSSLLHLYLSEAGEKLLPSTDWAAVREEITEWMQNGA